MKSSASLLMSPDNATGTLIGNVGDRMITAATVKIQLWYKSVKGVSKFCIMKNEYFCDEDETIKGLINSDFSDLVDLAEPQKRSCEYF